VIRLTATLLVCGITLAGCEVTDDSVKWIDVDRAAELNRERAADPLASVFIDPRPSDSFQAAHIPGAVNMSVAAFDGEKGINPRVSQFKTIVVYGQNPGDPSTTAAAKRLLQIGYSGVYGFAGGLDDWKRAALPIESGPGAPLPAVTAPSRRGDSR